MAREVTVIALYLPQFHPIPENDEWWGEGFTEWTNTAKAKPLFRGHAQPLLPADLGFYDLRVPETRAAQAELARTYGVDAFCYYHYWFAGRRLIERPFEEVLASGQPDLPFCLCWANESWTGVWHGAPNRMLMEQTYPGAADHEAHFAYLLRAFRDPRYVRVDGRPLFMVYRPRQIPDVEKVVEFWRRRAAEEGLPGLHLVGWKYPDQTFDPRDHGFDAIVSGFQGMSYGRRQPFKWLRQRVQRALGRPLMYYAEDLVGDLARAVPDASRHHPCTIPNWDNTPRSGLRGTILAGATPALFRQQVRDALRAVEPLEPSRRIVFVKSWNEWAEGNHLEPDLLDGHAWLEALRDEIATWKATQARHAAPPVGNPVVSGEQRRTI